MTITIEAAFDISDIGDVSLSVVETGGASFTATVSSGQYFLTYSAAGAVGDFASEVSSVARFLDALAAALTAAGTGTYTCAHSSATNRVSISQSGGAVTAISVTPVANGDVIGLRATAGGALTVECQAAPYYRIVGASGCYSKRREREEKKNLAWDVVASSGRVSGMSRPVAAKRLDVTLPLEPRAIVEALYATVDDPWTWEHLFRHARNQQPLLMDDGVWIRYAYLTADGAAWAPRSIADSYEAYYDIEILSWLQAHQAVTITLLATESSVTLTTESGAAIGVDSA